MSDLFSDPDAAWAALLIVTLPLVIIGIGEWEERLRQRDSPYRAAVSVLRVWVVPLFSLWVLARALFNLTNDDLVLALIGTALVVAATSAALSAIAVAAQNLHERPRREGQRPIPRLLLALPRVGVALLSAWLLVAGVWQVDLSSLLAALGVGSLVVSFALQDTLSGLASGFLLLSDQPFQPGDWITVADPEGLEGRVVDINYRSTRVEDRNGDIVVIPNGVLAGAIITNFDEPSRVHRVVVELQVAYQNPPTSAKEMLLDAARATPGVLADPPPKVMVTQIDDPLMGYKVHLWVDDYSIAPSVKSDFGSLVWYQSHRHDVPLPSPAQDLFLWDGVRTELEGRIDAGEIRRRLQTSPLLDDLDEESLDLLAGASRAERYKREEAFLVERSGNDLFLLVEGQARLVMRTEGEPDIAVLTLEPGEFFGVLDHSAAEGRRPVVVATSDCEVVVIGADAAGTVISRTPALSRAVEQLVSTRNRRIGRVMRRHGSVPEDAA